MFGFHLPVTESRPLLRPAGVMGILHSSFTLVRSPGSCSLTPLFWDSVKQDLQDFCDHFPPSSSPLFGWREQKFWSWGWLFFFFFWENIQVFTVILSWRLFKRRKQGEQVQPQVLEWVKCMEGLLWEFIYFFDYKIKAFHCGQFRK